MQKTCGNLNRIKFKPRSLREGKCLYFCGVNKLIYINVVLSL